LLTLSYGQRRRTLLARALAGKPQVLLLDEVFNGLDSVSARILRSVLQHDRGGAGTWILTTHRAHDVPPNVTHVAKLEEGRLVLATPAREQFAHKSFTQKAFNQKAFNQKAFNKLSRITALARPPSPTRRVRKSRTKAGTTSLVRLREVDLYRDYRLVLRDVDWDIARGEHWAILGRNGSGKSTLLKLLYGDLHPRLGGTIERAGVPFGTPISEWKRRVGFVSPELQAEYFLARDLEEIVVSGRYASVGLNEAATNADLRAARRWLKFFGLQELAHRGPRTVSYGQMRLALLARAMINDPELLLLDEPCTGLDPDIRTKVLTVLTRLAKRGVQLVMAVHDQNDIPACVQRELRIERGGKVRVEER
jgi:molybdate transport system ATP-binding protein